MPTLVEWIMQTYGVEIFVFVWGALAYVAIRLAWREFWADD